jgi:hypothetical protein
MFAWIKKLFQTEEDSYTYTDLTPQIIDIKQRIDEQRAKLNYDTPKLDSTTELPQENKKAELNNLKAKLLGKKGPLTK